MDPLSILMGVAGAAGAGIAMALARRGEGSRLQRWKRRAAECGLGEIETYSTFPFRAALEARRGRHAVRLERFKRGKSRRGTRVVVRGLAVGLSLKGEGFGSGVEKTLGRREIETGDERFDAELFVRGEAKVLRAFLDAETRRLLRDVFAGRIRMAAFLPREVDVSVWVADGELRVEFPDRLGGQDEPQSDTLRILLALAERLAPVDRLDTRLAATALSDPLPSVRVHALTTLAHDFADSPATRETLAEALQDPDPEVRLQAALLQHDAVRPVLEELASSNAATDVCSTRALEVLSAREGLTLEVARRTLQVARSARKVQTARAVLPALARGGGDDVSAVVQAVADLDDRVAEAAVRALVGAGAPIPEEPLLQALTRGSHELVLAAAVALGRVGSALAVMPLKRLEVSGGWGVDKAAREAVARIQSRLSGATPGQLALADDASGQVSLSQDPSGRVTLPSGEPGSEE